MLKRIFQNIDRQSKEHPERLALKRLDLPPEELVQVAEKIGRLAGLKKLDISYSQLHKLSPEQASRFVQALAPLQELEELDLSSNAFGNFDFACFFNVVQELSRLINLNKLNLFDNRLGLFDGAHVVEVAQALGGLGLKELNLSSNQLGHLDDVHVVEVAEKLGRSRGLEKLNLFNNNLKILDKSHAIHFAQALGCLGLKELDFSLNEFCKLHHVHVFSRLSGLKELDLSCNGFGNLDAAGAIGFVEALPSLGCVQSLNLQSNNLAKLGGDMVVQVANALQGLKCLRILNLSSNGPFDDQCAVAFATELAKSKTITSLDLGFIGTPGQCSNGLLQAVRKSRSLQMLFLSPSSISFSTNLSDASWQEWKKTARQLWLNGPGAFRIACNKRLKDVSSKDVSSDGPVVGQASGSNALVPVGAATAAEVPEGPVEVEQETAFGLYSLSNELFAQVAVFVGALDASRRMPDDVIDPWGFLRRRVGFLRRRAIRSAQLLGGDVVLGEGGAGARSDFSSELGGGASARSAFSSELGGGASARSAFSSELGGGFF
jgi:Leucine-rich repeat (LRR) protein